MLLRANQAIAVQNDLRSGIRTIIQSATEAVACQRCTLFLVSRARQQLTVATSAGFNEGAHAKLADVKLAIDSKSLVGHCAKVAKGHLVPATRRAASLSPTCVCHRPTRLATVSWLAMPTLTRASIQASIKQQSTVTCWPTASLLCLTCSHPSSSFRTKSVACVPLKDRNGNVLAVVEAVNKLRGSSAARVQTPKKMLPARATSSERHASSTVRCDPCPTVNQRPDLTLTPFHRSCPQTGAGAGAGAAAGTPTGTQANATPSIVGSFTDDDVSVLESIGEMAGGVLERLQLNHKQRRIQKRLESLFGLMRTLLGERSASALLAKVASVCKELLGVERVSLFQVHPATKVRWGGWKVGIVDQLSHLGSCSLWRHQQLILTVSEDAAGLCVPMGQGLAGHAAMYGETIQVRTAEAIACRCYSQVTPSCLPCCRWMMLWMTLAGTLAWTRQLGSTHTTS